MWSLKEVITVLWGSREGLKALFKRYFYIKVGLGLYTKDDIQLMTLFILALNPLRELSIITILG